jgi:endoglucanase
MNTLRKIVWLFSSLISLSQAGELDNTPRYPFPQHVQYAANTIKPNHVGQAKLDDHIRAYYDTWKKNYVVKESTLPKKKNLYRISYGLTDHSRTVSEGQGYGMVIVALMAGYDKEAQVIFDGLYRFSRQHPSQIDSRLMAWQCGNGIKPTDSAFDGDVDIAYGLLLADKQWGSKGDINYQDAARNVINGILESTIGVESHLPLLGDSVNRDGNAYRQFTPRSSDLMPAQFKAFARFTGNPRWNKVVTASQTLVEYMQKQYSPKTGLLPDFIEYKKPAKKHFLEGDHDGEFFYNAGRVPLRLGMDALLNDDASSRQQIQKMSAWLKQETNGDPHKIKPGYSLEGKPFRDGFISFFVAPFGVAAMVDPSQQAWLNAIYDSIYNNYQDYYEDTVNLLSLLVMTGNFWDPSTQ